MYEEMNDRAIRSGNAQAEPDTVVHRASGARDRTRSSALTDETVRYDVAQHSDLLAVDNALLAGRYELGAVLGRGATGVVYRGRDRVLCRDVAIKVLYNDLAGQHETSARFRQEAQLAARIHHPNAVAIFDTGVHEGRQFIVMECLPGDTLATRIAEHPLPFDEVRTIGAQLLGALDAAHQNGVIHRDIKPANLLMTSTGGVKVADFGIATDADGLALTSVGFVVGTLAYLAPERLRDNPATARSDIYAAGVVLYEMLTGRKPFAGDTPAEMLDQISNASPIDITSLRPDIDPKLANVVMRALEKDPGARYSSAAAMAQALERSRTNKPRSSLPPPAPTVAMVALTEAGRPHRGGRSVIAAVLATIIAALIVAALVSHGGELPVPEQPASPATTASASAPSTTAVTTTTRPATTRAPATTARTTTGKGKKND